MLSGCQKTVSPQDLKVEGDKFYRDGNFIKAESAYEGAVKGTASQSSNSDCDVLMNLGNTKWELKKFADARSVHESALDCFKSHAGPESERAADAHLRLGIDAVSLSDRKAAKAHYEASLKILKKLLPRSAAKVKQLQNKLKALADNK